MLQTNCEILKMSNFFKNKLKDRLTYCKEWKHSVDLYLANKEILKGVTRTVLINLIKSLRFKLIEKEFSIKELFKADEVFITSSGSFVTPIIQIDNLKINNKKIGKITKLLALNLYKSII